MRGKSTRPIRTAGRSRNALVRRHARLTPDESRPLRLDATQQQRSLLRELPSISTYSVLEKKNVSQKKENTFEGLKGLYIVRRAGQARLLLDSKSGFQGNLRNSTVKSSRQTAEFGEQALESLADGIRRGSVEVREFFSVGSV